jgi:hypothetical protein
VADLYAVQEVEERGRLFLFFMAHRTALHRYGAQGARLRILRNSWYIIAPSEVARPSQEFVHPRRSASDGRPAGGTGP